MISIMYICTLIKLHKKIILIQQYICKKSLQLGM